MATIRVFRKRFPGREQARIAKVLEQQARHAKARAKIARA